MGDKITYELNIKKKPDISLHKYEIFDHLIKFNNLKSNSGIQTIQEFITMLNPNNDYNIFHYILLSNKDEDTNEVKFGKFIKVIKFLYYHNNNNYSYVLTLLERKDRIGNLPLYYIIYQGNIPLYSIYESLFKDNINRCLNNTNKLNLTILNICQDKYLEYNQNLNNNYDFIVEYLNKSNNETLQVKKINYKKSTGENIDLINITSTRTKFFNLINKFIIYKLRIKGFMDQKTVDISKQYTSRSMIGLPQQQTLQPQPQSQPQQPQQPQQQIQQSQPQQPQWKTGSVFKRK